MALGILFIAIALGYYAGLEATMGVLLFLGLLIVFLGCIAWLADEPRR